MEGPVESEDHRQPLQQARGTVGPLKRLAGSVEDPAQPWPGRRPGTVVKHKIKD